jgi:hypothetical protein
MEWAGKRPRGSRQPPTGFGTKVVQSDGNRQASVRQDHERYAPPENRSTRSDNRSNYTTAYSDNNEPGRARPLQQDNGYKEVQDKVIPVMSKQPRTPSPERRQRSFDLATSPRFELYSPELESGGFLGHGISSSPAHRASLSMSGSAAIPNSSSYVQRPLPSSLTPPSPNKLKPVEIQNKENLELRIQSPHSSYSQYPLAESVHGRDTGAGPHQQDSHSRVGGLVHSCIVCQIPLIPNDRGVRTDYGISHLECFRCHECHESLEHSQFYFENNRMFCHLDYHEVHSPKCAFCKTPVESKGISAMGNIFHSNHFFCTQCSKVLGAEDLYYVIDKDKVCCSQCHDTKTNLTCWKCKFASEQLIDALGRTWCSSCSICDSCTQALDEEFILREDGDIVCKDCEIKRIKMESWS